MYTFNADFWSVVDQEGEYVDAMALLKEIGDVEPKKRLLNRTAEYSDYMEILDISHGQCFGGGAKIRKGTLPRRFNLRTITRQELGFGADEGLEEAVYFLYDSKLQVLVTQRHSIFRSSALERLLNDLGDTDVSLEPKLRKDVLTRLNNMWRLGKLTVRARTAAYDPKFSNKQHSFGEMIEGVANDANAYTVELTLGMAGSRSQGLNLQWVKNIVRQLRVSESIEKLQIIGNVEKGQPAEAIDFIRDRLVFSERVEYPTRSLTEDACRRLLRGAIERRREYLKSLL